MAKLEMALQLKQTGLFMKLDEKSDEVCGTSKKKRINQKNLKECQTEIQDIKREIKQQDDKVVVQKTVIEKKFKEESTQTMLN